MSKQSRPIDLTASYVQLQSSGAAKVWNADDFWQAVMGEAGEDLEASAGLLISSYEFKGDWPHWEMHPAGDEIATVLQGEIVFVFEEKAGLLEIPVKAGDTLVIPKGVWHWAKVKAPVKALFVTNGQGTQHRPC